MSVMPGLLTFVNMVLIILTWFNDSTYLAQIFAEHVVGCCDGKTGRTPN